MNGEVLERRSFARYRWACGNTDSVSVKRPSLPTPDEWRRWEVDVVEELHAGKQSRVFEAMFDGQRTAVKLTEARLADPAVLTERLRAVEALGTLDPGVVAPIRFGGALVQPIGEWLITATPFIDGAQLDETVVADAELLGRSLARLHSAMSRLATFSIPPVAALRSTEHASGRSDWQLLHGDFSNQNVIKTSTLLRVFDFDDCGYGPIEYDIANSLYMVLFDAEVAQCPERFEVFRPAFLAGYVDGSKRRVAEASVDEMIAVRIDALARWLDDLTSAPIGIRTASPEWLETLAGFVQSHGSAERR